MSGGIDKYQFQYDPRFASLRNQGVSFEDFKAHEEFFVKKLGNTSIMDLYNKGKALYETYTNLYNQQNNIFIQLKNQKNSCQADYNALIANFEKQNKQQLAKNGQSGSFAVTTAQINTARQQSGYTLALINNTNQAELAADMLLDKRFAAVDMQRSGMYYNC